MARNVKISEYTGRFENPAVQLNTSVTQIMNEGIELPVSQDMQFTSDLVKDYSPHCDCLREEIKQTFRKTKGVQFCTPFLFANF